jgi:hypothetical protein
MNVRAFETQTLVGHKRFGSVLLSTVCQKKKKKKKKKKQAQ